MVLLNVVSVHEGVMPLLMHYLEVVLQIGFAVIGYHNSRNQLLRFSSGCCE